jgi:protoheme IX farnesyltransferase
MENEPTQRFSKTLIKLTRLYLSLAIAFSALAGHIFYSGSFKITGFFVFAGVLLLSCGASALNQYQERKADALMKRTRNRPLPSGKLSPQQGLVIALMFCVSGILVLWLGTNLLTAGLGLFNLFWYNAVYTPLKRVTSYVVLIGALTGAIPPLMGWTAAGGSLLGTEIWLVALFMFLWQVPHFYLLLMKFGEEYEMAGFPSITSQYSVRHVQIVTFLWIIGTSVSTLLFPFFKVLSSVSLIVGLVLMNTMLILFFCRITFSSKTPFTIRPAFRSLYLFQVIILILLMAEALK